MRLVCNRPTSQKRKGIPVGVGSVRKCDLRMTELFETIVNMSMVGSFTIIAVLLVRLLFFKSPKRYAYILWSVVFLRLIIPHFPVSDFGAIPAELSHKEHVYMAGGLLGGNVIPSVIWFIGAICVGGYHLLAYMRFKRQIGFHQQAEDGVYEMKGEHLSFILGIFRPRIYLSGELNEEGREAVLCHERIHLKRRDYLIKPAALFIACVHWFNPLVWLAFYLMNRDCEMACDEAVVATLGNRCRKVYAYALLDEATRGRSGWCKRESTCAILSLGEDNIKNRISHVIHFKKAPAWLIAATVVFTAVFLVTFGSDRFIREHSFSAAIATGCNAIKYEEKGTRGYLTIIMDGSGEKVIIKVDDDVLKEQLHEKALSGIKEVIFNLDTPYGGRTNKHTSAVDVGKLLTDRYYEQYLELKKINFKGE